MLKAVYVGLTEGAPPFGGVPVFRLGDRLLSRNQLQPSVVLPLDQEDKAHDEQWRRRKLDCDND